MAANRHQDESLAYIRAPGTPPQKRYGMAALVCNHCGEAVDIELNAAPAYSRDDRPEQANDAAIALALQGLDGAAIVRAIREANANVVPDACPNCRNLPLGNPASISNGLKWWLWLSWLALFVLIIWVLIVTYNSKSDIQAVSKAVKSAARYTVTTTRTTTSRPYGYYTVTVTKTTTLSAGATATTSSATLGTLTFGDVTTTVTGPVATATG